jgi:hypothetical protein
MMPGSAGMRVLVATKPMHFRKATMVWSRWAQFGPERIASRSAKRSRPGEA